MKKLFNNLKNNNSKKDIEERILENETLINENFDKIEMLSNNKDEIENLKKQTVLQIENIKKNFESGKEKYQKEFETKEKALAAAFKKKNTNFIIGTVFFIIVIGAASGFYISSKIGSLNSIISSKDTEIQNRVNEITALNDQILILDKNVELLTAEINQFKAGTRSLEQYAKVDKDKLINNLNPFIYTSDTKEASNNYIKALQAPSFKEVEDKGDYFVYRELSDVVINNLANNTDSIYPGAIILGETANSPYVALVSQPRTNMEITSNFNSQSKYATSDIISNVSLPNVRSSINKIVKNNLSSSFVTDLTYNQVDITEDFNVQTGLNIGVDISKINAAFNSTFNFKSNKTNKAITFEQTYYEINAIAKPQPIDYFLEGSDLSSLGSFSPVYVSQVNYGRNIMTP